MTSVIRLSAETNFGIYEHLRFQMPEIRMYLKIDLPEGVLEVRNRNDVAIGFPDTDVCQR